MTGDDTEDQDYMDERHLEFFKEALLSIKNELLKKDEKIKQNLQKYCNNAEVDDALMSAQKREVLLKDVNDALQRCDDGTFGFCEKSGEPIGYGRLKIQPTAKYCVEIQEKIEKQRKFLNDDYAE